MLRTAVAALFVLSVAAAGMVDDGGEQPSRSAAPAPTTTAPSTTTTVSLPPPTTTSTAPPAPVTLPPPPPSDARVVVSPRGVVLPVVGVEGSAFRVTTPCGAQAVLGGGTPIAGAAVVLDPGHGGDEPGAIGPNGLTEAVLNLAVAHHAKAALERAGVSVVLTRTGQYRLPLNARARIVTALEPRAFVSVHHNAEPDGPFPKPGAETYYQTASADSKRLAGLLYEEIVKALSPYQVPWVADTDAGAKYRRNDRGDDYYGILRLSKGTPSVLAELGFISNGPEADLYARPDVQQVEGEAVARGIIRYLTTADPGSGFTEPYPRTSPAGGGGGARNCVDPPL